VAKDSSNNKTIVVKIFKDMSADTQDSFKKEIAIASEGLFHKNIVQLIGAGKDVIMKNGKPYGGAEVFYIVSELCANGEMFEYIQLAEGLPERVSVGIFGQVVDAVAAVHAKSVAHRDIKLENIFLDKNVCPKLADFGMQKAFGQDKLLATRCGTDQYMAPELNTTGEQEGYDGTKVDVFALGQVLYTMMFANHAFWKSTDAHYKQFISNPRATM